MVDDEEELCFPGYY